ncbi:trypsin-like peptidase domain-containing protein [candidate division TA06 bacterium]|nr:trypsin-like peptidase domain-containing protein [candidate division TA06 bacterium]
MKKAIHLIPLLLGGVFLGVLGYLIFFPHPSQTLEPIYVSASYESPREEVTHSRRNAIVRAAEKVGPTVVSISVIQTRVYRSSPFPSFGDPFLEDFFKDFFTPRVYKRQIQRLGSGVIIKGDGYILTNEHVVHNAEKIKVTLSDGREFDGEILGSDPTLDLALLKVKGKDLPFANLSDSDDLIIGEWAIAIGNPFGYLLEDTQPTVTVGVISALNRSIKAGRSRVQVYQDMIQTDAAINPGNSGGPLVNAEGEVIGINTFIFTSSGGSEGIGFARPINDAKTMIDEILQYGEVRKVWIGIHVQKVTPLLAESLDLKRVKGFLVSHVDERSPAETAGIEPGDVIYEVNGKKMEKEGDWKKLLYETRVGERIKVVGEREGKSFEKPLIVQEMPG